jgi:demethylmenaquinone methyltransferase/2-methoxy-6-polyprenyl-1,4-benzoquinol methylase
MMPPPRRAAANPEARWFGDAEVEAGERTRLVRGVFGRVAPRYDLMNDLMSAGIHRLWKDRFVAMAAPRPGELVLDLAGGTGDVALRLAARQAAARIVLCDASPAMAARGRDRAIDVGRAGGLAGGLAILVGDAERLPLPDRSFDLCTIAFGLRNVTRIDDALAEARRILKPGGRFLCLEFSRVSLPLLRGLYDAYSFGVIPRLGALVLKDAASYRYLVESIRRFPDQEALAGRMAGAGFSRVRWSSLSGGIVAIHRGWRI